MKFVYGEPSRFEQSGFLLARVVPRCGDPNSAIRKVAVECVCTILCIAERYEGCSQSVDDTIRSQLEIVRENIEKDDFKLLYELCKVLGSIIAARIPKHQLGSLIDGLLDAMLDVESSSSMGASIVLNSIFETEGGQLTQHVHNIMVKLTKLLEKIKSPGARNMALKSVRSLASHHLKTVLNVILIQQLPFPQYVFNNIFYLVFYKYIFYAYYFINISIQ